MSKYGSICSDIAKHPLADQDECRMAAISLNKEYSMMEENTKFPKGCYAARNGYVYWNIHLTGKRNIVAGEICRSGSRFFK